MLFQNKPKNIDRRGATRDSYKNATEPATEPETATERMKSISEEKTKVAAPPPPGQKSVPLKTDEERSKDEVLTLVIYRLYNKIYLLQNSYS